STSPTPMEPGMNKITKKRNNSDNNPAQEQMNNSLVKKRYDNRECEVNNININLNLHVKNSNNTNINIPGAGGMIDAKRETKSSNRVKDTVSSNTPFKFDPNPKSPIKTKSNLAEYMMKNKPVSDGKKGSHSNNSSNSHASVILTYNLTFLD